MNITLITRLCRLHFFLKSQIKRSLLLKTLKPKRSWSLFPYFLYYLFTGQMANFDKQPKISSKQFQFIMASRFNMKELLKNTTPLLAGNDDGSNDQNAALDLSLNGNNISRKLGDNESCYSYLGPEEKIDSNEEDIDKLDQMLKKTNLRS